MRNAVYQLLFLDRIPDHAVVNEAVNLTKRQSWDRKASGTVNAVLRKIISNRLSLPVPEITLDTSTRLAVKYSHPEWLIKRWIKDFGLANTKKLMEYNNSRPVNYLRRKLRGVTRVEFENEMRGKIGESSGYSGLYYGLKSGIPFKSTEAYKYGFGYVQSPSSGWAVSLLDVKKGKHVLEICSAPGGKTALISELAGDEGLVIACDNDSKRMELVTETVERTGLFNVHPVVCDCRDLPLKKRFSKILLDAPCTGTGVMSRYPESRWERTEEDIQKKAEVQSALLEAALDRLKIGGELVYSTCSLQKEENQGVVEGVLKRRKEFERKRPAGVPENMITSSGYLFITPFEHSLDGIFGAKIRRVE